MRAFFPYDPAILAQLRHELAALDELWRWREAALRAPAAPGSLVAADAPLPDARFVRMYAGQALGTALDHLAAWRSLLNGPALPMVAHLTLIRGGLEGAVRCRWHVEPTKDSATRVARGLAARRDDQVDVFLVGKRLAEDASGWDGRLCGQIGEENVGRGHVSTSCGLLDRD